MRWLFLYFGKHHCINHFMRTSEKTLTPSFNPGLIGLSSLFIPGLGQFLLKRRGHGLLILLTTIVSAFLIQWTLVHQNVGKVTIAGRVTSWLWLPLLLF